MKVITCDNPDDRSVADEGGDDHDGEGDVPEEADGPGHLLAGRGRAGTGHQRSRQLDRKICQEKKEKLCYSRGREQIKNFQLSFLALLPLETFDTLLLPIVPWGS